LDVETTRGCGFAEHFGLQLARAIPSRLSAHRRIERKYEAAALARLCRRSGAKGFDAIKKAIDLRARRGRRRMVFRVWRDG
jgi:hypothetical protein